MNKLLNIVSIFGGFLIAFGFLFLIQDVTIGRIHFLNKLMIYEILPFKYLLFTASSLLIISKYVRFYKPNRLNI